jgi:hypothetical protein
VPARAWVVTFAGTAVNLCLGILYAWSVWKANLIADAAHPAGSPMTGSGGLLLAAVVVSQLLRRPVSSAETREAIEQASPSGHN